MKMLVPEGAKEVFNSRGDLLVIASGVVEVDDAEVKDYERVGFVRAEKETKKPSTGASAKDAE
jgi:hypothetical protein